MSTISEIAQWNAIHAAMKVGLATGVTKLSKSGKTTVFADTSRRSDLSSDLDTAIRQIETAGLRAEFDAALTTEIEEGNKKEAAASKRAAAAKQLETMFKMAYESACKGELSLYETKPLDEAKLTKPQTARLAGIRELNERIKTEREQRRIRQQAEWAAQDAQRATEKAQREQEQKARRATLAATRFMMRVDKAPSVGATFRDGDDILVCTGHSANSWYLSQSQIDDNDDFEFEGHPVTYVYFRAATDAEKAAFTAAEEIATNQRNEGRARAQAIKTLISHAKTGERGSGKYSLSESARILMQNKPSGIWHGGDLLAIDGGTVVYEESRPLGGDWMDDQPVYTWGAAPLSTDDESVRHAISLMGGL